MIVNAMGTNMARFASWATGLFNKARSAALNRPVANLAMSAIFRAPIAWTKSLIIRFI